VAGLSAVHWIENGNKKYQKTDQKNYLQTRPDFPNVAGGCRQKIKKGFQYSYWKPL
jgi:hypothetical protein